MVVHSGRIGVCECMHYQETLLLSVFLSGIHEMSSKTGERTLAIVCKSGNIYVSEAAPDAHVYCRHTYTQREGSSWITHMSGQTIHLSGWNWRLPWHNDREFVIQTWEWICVSGVSMDALGSSPAMLHSPCVNRIDTRWSPSLKAPFSRPSLGLPYLSHSHNKMPALSICWVYVCVT